MKKLLVAFFIAAAALFAAQYCCAAAADAAKPAGKTKSDLKVDKETLKKKVRTLSNGDTVTGAIPISKELCTNFPRLLDSYIGYLMPWVDIKEVDSAVGAKNINAVYQPQDFVKAVNTAMGKYACRLKNIPTTEVVIKQKIQAGIPLYWFCSEDNNIWGYVAARTQERKNYKPDDWKKLLAQKGYKPNVSQQNIRGYSSFVVLGYNPKTGEIGISSANNSESLSWITIQEMKKYNVMLVEAAW